MRGVRRNRAVTARHRDANRAPLMPNPWQSLAAAVVESAIADLQDGRHRADAVAWLEAGELDQYLVDAGLDISASACRLALRRRGLLPDESDDQAVHSGAQHAQATSRLCRHG